MNCRSVTNKVDNLASLINMTNPSVVLGSESWLNSEISDSEIVLTNYTACRRDRARHGGCVFMLLKREIYSKMLEVGTQTIELMWVKLRLQNGKTVSVCSFYRPPSSQVQEMNDLNEEIEAVNGDHVIMGGDFNLPELGWNKPNNDSRIISGSCKELLKMCNCYSLTQLVRQPTRGNNVLDLLLTDLHDQDQQTIVLPGVSDHSAVFCELSLRHVKVTDTGATRIYSYKKANTEKITEALDRSTTFSRHCQIRPM